MSVLRQREPRFESKSLRELCHKAPFCFIRIPGTCETLPTECVHSDAQKHGRGMNSKTHDYETCPGCRPCHLAYSRNQDELQEYMDRGIASWRHYIFSNRLVRVA